LQQSNLHPSTLQKLRNSLQHADAGAGADPYGAGKIVWNEAEQVMNKDGFAKLALEKDTTLSGITAEFSAWDVMYNMYADATGNSEADMEREISVVSHLTEENADEYNVYIDILGNRCMYAYMWEDPWTAPTIDGGARSADIIGGTTRRDDPDKFYPYAEEIRTIFADSIDAFVKKLQEDYASGAISEEMYKDRQNKINEAYDKFAYIYGNYGQTDYYYMNAHYGTDVFSAWETSLNDIKARYERGDFGFEEGVYEERVAAWSAAFDKWADKETKSFSRSPAALTSIASAAMFGGDPYQKDLELYWEDTRKLYENAKNHLLAGKAAQDLTDDILNRGLAFASAGDRRFFYSDEYLEMIADVDRQSRTVKDRSKTQSQDKKEWDDLYERFARRVKSNTSLGETMRNILLQYFDLAATRLPQIYKGNFLPG
jgi:hypothetical protein